MNLRALRLFAGLMDHGTLTRAAERMHLSQSAASRLIGLLEADMGVMLFSREQRRMVPTAAAEALYPESLRILAQIDALPEALRSDAPAPLRVLCQTRLVPGLAVPAIARLADEGGPPIRLEAAPRRELARRAAASRHDVVLATLPLPMEGVAAEALCTVPLGVLVAREHPLARRPRLTTEDLQNVPYIALDQTTVIRRMLDAGPHALPAPRIETSTGSAAYRLVAEGLGFTFADTLAVESELWDRVILRPWAERAEIAIGTAPMSPDHAAAKAFEAALRDIAAANCRVTGMSSGT